MKRLVFVVSLSAALSLVGAENAYVNSASAAPESPYDTWANAATLYADAYGAVDAGGTITFSEGTYTDSASLSDKSVVIRAVKSPTDDRAGTVTMGGTLYSAKFANNTDDSKYRLTYAKGTFSYVANNVFSDYPTGSWGLSPRFVITFAGTDTCMDASSSTMYACYGCKNSTVRFTDGADGTVAKLNLGGFAGKGDGGSLVVDGAATFTCSGDANVGIKDGEKDFSIVVSNGVLSCSGANGLTIGSSTSGSNRLVVAGATSRVTLSKACFYNAMLSFNVGEAPLNGYAEPPVAASSALTFDANSHCEIVGLQELKERLDAAEVMASSFVLMTLGVGASSIALPEAVLIELRAQVSQVSRFRLDVNPEGRPGSLVLTYLPQTVYVVPAGTDGNVPTAPYATWTTAANSIKEAESAVAVGGKVVIASGTYDVGAKYFLRDERVELMAVASPDAEDEPGEVTVPHYGFATGYANVDNDVFNAILTCGKFNFDIVGNGIAYVEYMPDTKWGKICNCKLTLSGSHTVVAQSSVDLYSGYTSQNTILRVTDHASLTVKRMYVGDLKHANGSTVVVDNGGTITNEIGFVIARYSNNNRLLITNAVCVTSWINMGDAETSGSACVLAGENPQLLLTASGTASVFSGDSRLVFDVGDAPLTGYAAAPLTGYWFSLDDSFIVNVEGCNRLKDRLVAAEQRKLTLDLIHSKDTKRPIPFGDERLAAIQATLPEYFSISKTADGAKVQLRYRVPSGLAIILR